MCSLYSLILMVQSFATTRLAFSCRLMLLVSSCTTIRLFQSLSSDAVSILVCYGSTRVVYRLISSSDRYRHVRPSHARILHFSTPLQKARTRYRIPLYIIISIHVLLLTTQLSIIRVPLGFEPHSLDFNNNTGLEHKVSMLKAYWTQAVKIAEQARIIALCRLYFISIAFIKNYFKCFTANITHVCLCMSSRNETLLIYFATDDVRGLRPEAKRLLSSFGEVVFGLTDEEVGSYEMN